MADDIPRIEINGCELCDAQPVYMKITDGSGWTRVEWFTNPHVMDLSKDPGACGVLRHLARHPWEEACWKMLRDRVEELGGPVVKFDAWRKENKHEVSRAVNRRAMARHLKRVRDTLKMAFGDFEPAEIPF
jgi:hypothetical protein